MKELVLTNGYDVYTKDNGDLVYHSNVTKEQALEMVGATQFNYHKASLHDMRFKLVHQTETHAIFKE